jgi:peptide/nickel transport system ATP-binding protein
MSPAPLLQVQELSVALDGAAGPRPVLQGLDLTIERGQTLGLIGESGCGKSMAALALMGLLPEGARASGSVRLDGQELLALDERGWCGVRGARIGMVFQEPMSALNPLHPIGRQVAEGLRLHRGLDARAARAEALRLLERVQLPRAADRLDAWPHQLSGGQRQRVLIAMALAARPALLIADEPTTALDVVLQREVLDLLGRLVAEDGLGLLLISHDLGVMAHSVARLAVMYAGRLVETGPTRALLRGPRHPYTHGLLASRPRLGAPRGDRLPVIPGRVPAPGEWPAGCAFAPRCPRATAECSVAEPALAGADRAVRCLHPHEGAP